jgi:transcriptional regulator NrdR family protein
MICPKCKEKTKVIDISHNDSDNEEYRRRKCTACEHIFYTVEYEVEYDEYVREVFNRNNRHNYIKKRRKK